MHEQINRHAQQAKVEIIKHGMRARSEIDELMERYRLEDLFRARSEGQKRRWANFKRFNGDSNGPIRNRS